ncbi:hypothetical protein ACF0H5_010681 [Mactra antiquata]
MAGRSKLPLAKGQGGKAKATIPSDHFDFESFKTLAKTASVEQSFGGTDLKDYRQAIIDLEDSIIKKQTKRFENAMAVLTRVTQKKLTGKKMKDLAQRLEELRTKWNKGKSRGGDPFQNINVKVEMAPTTGPAPTTQDKKGSPPSKTGENVDIQRLREIAKILHDDNTQAAKPKESTDDILKEIEAACNEVVKLRQKSGVKGVTETARLKTIRTWVNQLEQCVKEQTFSEKGITLNEQDKEWKEICESLNNTMCLLSEEKQKQDRLDKSLKEKSNQLLSLITTVQPVVEKDKKKSKKGDDKGNESMNLDNLMDRCVSELQIRIDDQNNQGSRLSAALKKLQETNKTLVHKTQKQTKNTKAINNEQNELLQDLQKLTEHFNNKLDDLETTCKRYSESVNVVDTEIEYLEKDIDEWDEVQNIDVLKKLEKCLYLALRNARTELQKRKKEMKETKNQDKGKKLRQKVKQLCELNGFQSAKKDDEYVDALQKLYEQQENDRKLLITLKREICNLNLVEQNVRHENASGNSIVEELVSLTKAANANVDKLKETRRKESKELEDLQSVFLKQTQEIHKLAGDDNAPTEMTTPVDIMHKNALQQLQTIKASQDDLENRLKQMQSTLLKVVQGIYDLAHQKAPEKVIDPLDKMYENVQQELHNLESKHKDLNSEMKKCEKENRDFSRDLLLVLDKVSKTLMFMEIEFQPEHANYSEDFEKCLLAAKKIKVTVDTISENVEMAFDTIIGNECLWKGKKFDKSKFNYWRNIQKTIEILVTMAVDNGITGENVQKLEQTEKQLRGNMRAKEQDIEDKSRQIRTIQQGVDFWKDLAQKEKREKDDYLMRLSKMTAAKLMDNNPNIADLSDQNRPTKLADEYSQIYDNEWTDAYAHLEKNITIEFERVDKLLQIFLNVYEVCCKIRNQQLNGIKVALLRPAKYYSQNMVNSVEGKRDSENKSSTPQKGKSKPPEHGKSKGTPASSEKSAELITLDSELSQNITDIGKQTSPITIGDVMEFFKAEHKDLFEGVPIECYSKKIIRLCWLMRLQSPPVCIDSIEKKGSSFDKKKYREYTQSGKKIEFVVWPTLLLHEKGGILSKGTAQGMK